MDNKTDILSFKSKGEASENSLGEFEPTIGDKIKEFLDREGRKGEWLAQQIGVHRTTLSRIISGKERPGIETCRELERVMGLRPKELQIAAGHVLPEENESPEAFDAVDPEVKVLLLNFGKLPEETRRIIKAIAREVNQQAKQSKTD